MQALVRRLGQRGRASVGAGFNRPDDVDLVLADALGRRQIERKRVRVGPLRDRGGEHVGGYRDFRLADSRRRANPDEDGVADRHLPVQVHGESDRSCAHHARRLSLRIDGRIIVLIDRILDQRLRLPVIDVELRIPGD